MRERERERERRAGREGDSEREPERERERERPIFCKMASSSTQSSASPVPSGLHPLWLPCEEKSNLKSMCMFAVHESIKVWVCLMWYMASDKVKECSHVSAAK